MTARLMRRGAWLFDVMMIAANVALIVMFVQGLITRDLTRFAVWQLFVITVLIVIMSQGQAVWVKWRWFSWWLDALVLGLTETVLLLVELSVAQRILFSLLVAWLVLVLIRSLAAWYWRQERVCEGE